jgi:monoamine oxidase
VLSRRAVVAGASAALLGGAAPRLAWSATEADVIVIGAGLAGLNAALLLEAAGLSVIVIESEAHIGGRARTLDDLPGAPDAGGIQVGASYARLHALADRFGIARVPGGAFSPGILYHIGGKTVASKDWAGAAANHLSEAEREIGPAMLGAYFGAKLPRLAESAAWMTPGAIQALDQPYAQMLARLGASTEAIRLIAANLNGNRIDHLSALNVARALAAQRAGPPGVSVIKGGTQRLPEAMARALKNAPRLGQRVQAISEETDSVRVSLIGGRRISARHVIATIPFAALRDVRLSGASAKQFAPLIKALPYTRATFAFLSAREPFWRTDGLPETLWSDSPLIGRVFVLGDDPAMLKVWIGGENADRLDAVSDAASGAAIIAAIELARPSAKGKLSLAKGFSWSKQRSARGIYHHIGAGQGAMLAAGVEAKGARLHFAGEHMARSSPGMEGALESGEQAARWIIARG